MLNLLLTGGVPLEVTPWGPGGIAPPTARAAAGPGKIGADRWCFRPSPPDHLHPQESNPGGAARGPDPQLRAARAPGRLIQFAALGGALLGAFVGIILNVVGEDESVEFEMPLLAGLIAGFAGGYLVGRGTVAIATWREPGGDARWGGLIWLLLVTPAYLVAGMVGLTVAAVAAGVAPGDLVGALGGSLSTLMIAWLVLGPMAVAFTPSMSGRPKVMHRNLLGYSGIFWVAAFTAMWFVGSFLAVLLVLAAAQSLDPATYDRAAESPLLLIATLVAWLVIWVGGSAAVYHALKRFLASHQPPVP